MQTLSFDNAVFISDLHLTEDRPDCIRAFFSFLEWLPTSTDALFILGDFFEYWVGDDIDTRLSQDITEKLNDTNSTKGISLFFIPGNRDFSVGHSYCTKAGMTLMPDNRIFSIAGLKVLTCHGDLLCTDDVGYQRFRKIIRTPIVLNTLLQLPISIRIKIAQRLRQNSKTKFNKNRFYVDVNAQAVDELFDSSHADVIVHGHTHLADIHLCGNENKRMVLGDWHEVGWYGVIDANGPRLHRFDIKNPAF